RSDSLPSRERIQEEDEIIDVFVSIRSLFHREPEVDHHNGGEEPSAENNMFSYLRMIERGGDGLPKTFVSALRRVLAYYGVQSLDRSAQLEQSLLWIYKSHQRVNQQIALVFRVLESRLKHVHELRGQTSDSFRVLLDRVISISMGVFPALHDLAREVRYRYFDQPLFEKARKQVYAQLEGHLAYLSANANPVDRHERVRALIDCPQPLASIFASRFGEAAANMRNLMLEALTLRFYRIRTLVNFHTVPFGDQSCVTAEYDYEGKRIHIFATHCDYENLRETLQNISSALQDVSSEEDVV